MAACANGDDKSDMEEQEEALVALIEHRTKEVNHLRMRLAYYESEVSLLTHSHPNLLKIDLLFG